MTRMNWRTAAIASATTVAASALALMLPDKLIVNGKSTAVETRVIDGSTYVKLSDMAKALDMVVVKRSDGQLELTKAGGANQINGLSGNIGDTIFDGKWRFTVLSVDSPDSFTMKTDSEPYGAGMPYEWSRQTRLLKATQGHKLVVIQCRVANGVKERRTLWTAISDDRIRTALTDQDGISYPPIAYDYEGAPIQTPGLLPGAQLTFPVIFSVPVAATLKDLVFTLKNNQGDERGVDVRISLIKP